MAAADARVSSLEDTIARIKPIKDANHCELLGVGRNPTPEQVKKAYLRLAKVLHPDKTRAAAPDAPPSARSLLRARTAGLSCRRSGRG